LRLRASRSEAVVASSALRKARGDSTGLGEGRSGNALRLVRPAADPGSYGARPSVTLSQTEARPAHLTGWSKAEGLSGDPDGAARIYLGGPTAPQSCMPVMSL
jgi:hypothetical protein